MVTNMPSNVDAELGFVEQDDLGFVEQPVPETYIQNATPTSFMSKVNSFFRDPEMEQAKAMNVYSLSKAAGISLEDANKNYDVLRKSSQLTGMTAEVEPMEFIGVALLPPIAAAAVVDFPMTAATLLAFGMLDKAVPTQEWIKSYEESQGFDIKTGIKTTIDLVDFLGKGVIAGGLTKSAFGAIENSGKLVNKWIGEKISEYKLPVDMAVISKIEEYTGIKPEIQPNVEALTTPKETTMPLGEKLPTLTIGQEKVEVPLTVPSVESITPKIGESKPQDFKTAEEYVASKIGQPLKSGEGEVSSYIQQATKDTDVSGEPISENGRLFINQKEDIDAYFKRAKELESKGLSGEELSKELKKKPVNKIEVKKVFRSVSKDEMMSILKSGKIKSDGRMNMGYEVEEGMTVYKDRDPRWYLPEEGGYIIEVNVTPESEFFYDKNDSYVKTRKAVDASNIVSINGKPFNKSQLTAEWQAAQGGTPPPPEKPTAVSPIPEGKKERGFITSVKESEMVGKETKEVVSELPKEQTTYDVYSDKEALAKAKDMVESDTEGSLTYIMSATELNKDVSTTGIELMRKYREQGDTAKEVTVATHLAEKATKAGQFIQAYSILDKLSPEGVLMFAAKEINKGVTDPLKIKKIDPKFAEELKQQAQTIQDTPYGYQKVKEINKLYEMIAQKKGKSTKDWVSEVANLPRTLMASFFDFSFGLRQGLFLAPSFAKEWGGAFSKQFGAFAKEKNYDALMDSVMKHPDFSLADNSGVAFTDIRGDLSKLEERYIGSNIAEKIPVLGKGVRATQRAYTGMANKMRMDVFSSLVKDAEAIGLNPRGNKNLAKEIATFVNAGTGRGGLSGTFAESASLLNAFFFSPRLMSSRLTLLNPQYYVTRTPYMRQKALKSLFGFMGTWATLLTMAKLSGAEVGTDPRSADFGKIKINNTRIDVGGGFGQYMRMAGQLISGKYVSSSTGKEYTLGEGYKPMTRFDILMRQIESKEAPIFSFISDVLKQKSWNGEDVNIPKEIGLRFTPMVISDMYDLLKNDPSLFPLGVLTIFGAGVQTYDKPKNKIKF